MTFSLHFCFQTFSFGFNLIWKKRTKIYSFHCISETAVNSRRYRRYHFPAITSHLVQSRNLFLKTCCCFWWLLLICIVDMYRFTVMHLLILNLACGLVCWSVGVYRRRSIITDMCAVNWLFFLYRKRNYRNTFGLTY